MLNDEQTGAEGVDRLWFLSEQPENLPQTSAALFAELAEVAVQAETELCASSRLKSGRLTSKHFFFTFEVGMLLKTKAAAIDTSVNPDELLKTRHLICHGQIAGREKPSQLKSGRLA